MEEQNIQWKHNIIVLKLLSKFKTQHKTIICFGVIVFLFNIELVNIELEYWTCQQQQKTW